jgi:hypothetical protein
MHVYVPSSIASAVPREEKGGLVSVTHMSPL